MESLTDEEMIRFSRQINLRGFDFDAQEKLRNSRVLVVGAGGLGCAAMPYLASSGIGQLTITDDDIVEIHNLQRQILHTESDVGRLKVDSAVEYLHELNSATHVTALPQRLHDAPMLTLIKQHDIVLDCTDNLTTRNQLNKLCYNTKTPLISGAAIRMEGQLSIFTYQNDTPCYQCYSQRFGEQSLSCVTNGVLGPVVGVIGAMQAVEAIKVLTGYGESAQSKVLLYDAMYASWRELKLKKLEGCPVCGDICRET